MDCFSKRFAAALLNAFPEWSDLVLQAEREDCLQLRIEAPSGNGHLSISTEGEEVTVGFDMWHTHYQENYWFPGYEGELCEQPFERVIQFLKDFLNDRVVIRIWTKNGEYAVSGPCHRWYDDNLSRAGCPGDEYSLKSWSGRWDVPSIPIDPDKLRKHIQGLEPRSGKSPETKR